MQKQKPADNLKSSHLRVTGADSMSRNRWTSLVTPWLVAATLLSSVNAEETNKSKPEETPTPETSKTVLNLWPGVAPGSEDWKHPETTLRPGAIANVTTPTLTLYLPSPSTATGTAVIIAPGGGFISLSIDSEGHDVAKWLVARGFASVVLKYRTVQLEGQDAAQIGQSAGARFGAQLRDLALIDEFSANVLPLTGEE